MSRLVLDFASARGLGCKNVRVVRRTIDLEEMHVLSARDGIEAALKAIGYDSLGFHQYDQETDAPWWHEDQESGKVTGLFLEWETAPTPNDVDQDALHDQLMRVVSLFATTTDQDTYGIFAEELRGFYETHGCLFEYGSPFDIRLAGAHLRVLSRMIEALFWLRKHPPQLANIAERLQRTHDLVRSVPEDVVQLVAKWNVGAEWWPDGALLTVPARDQKFKSREQEIDWLLRSAISPMVSRYLRGKVHVMAYPNPIATPGQVIVGWVAGHSLIVKVMLQFHMQIAESADMLIAENGQRFRAPDESVLRQDKRKDDSRRKILSRYRTRAYRKQITSERYDRVKAVLLAAKRQGAESEEDYVKAAEQALKSKWSKP